MKKSINYIFIPLFVAIVSACSHDELMDWDGGTNIYFTNMANSSVSARLNDITEVRFFYIDPTLDEVLVPIQITTTGTFTDSDREVYAAVAYTTGLEQGKHYEIASSKIRAGRVMDTLWVRLKRSDLKERERVDSLVVELRPNTNFSTNNAYIQDVPNGLPRSLLHYVIYVSDILVRPQFWGPRGDQTEFLGRYSPEKFHLVVNINSIPYGFLDGEPYNEVVLDGSASSMYPWLMAFGTRLQEYLNNWHNPDYAGDPLPLPNFPKPDGGEWSNVWPRDTIWEPALNQYGVREVMTTGWRITGR